MGGSYAQASYGWRQKRKIFTLCNAITPAPVKWNGAVTCLFAAAPYHNRVNGRVVGVQRALRLSAAAPLYLRKDMAKQNEKLPAGGDAAWVCWAKILEFSNTVCAKWPVLRRAPRSAAHAASLAIKTRHALPARYMSWLTAIV